MNNHTICAIVALGNPEPEYAQQRHNAGCWLFKRICRDFGVQLKKNNKLKGNFESLFISENKLVLYQPFGYMNLLGLPIANMLHYHKIDPQQTLILHDELDLSAGTIRLKQGGSSGGHNGLKSIIKHLGDHFLRVRIGIGHPKNAFSLTSADGKDAVHRWVLARPTDAERQVIEAGFDRFMDRFAWLMEGKWAKAMQALNTDAQDKSASRRKDTDAPSAKA